LLIANSLQRLADKTVGVANNTTLATDRWLRAGAGLGSTLFGVGLKLGDVASGPLLLNDARRVAPI
jgi:hypothetical protein